MTDDIEQLLAFGRIGLQTGYYEQARDYFEQALTLDPSNREAMRGLARVNEILSRREAVEPANSGIGPVQPEVTLAKPASKDRSITGWIRKERKEYADSVAKQKRRAAEEREKRARETGKRELVPTTPAVQPVATPSADHRKMLDYLVELHKAGILSDAEFEKKKADLRLDTSNQGATKGLLLVDEMLDSEMATAIEPMQVESVEPPHRVMRKRRVPEKETKEQERSPVQWFKRQSELWKIAIAGVPLLFLLCAGLANMINPTPEGLSTKERVYAMEIEDILEDWNTATFELAVLSYESSQNPLLLTDYNWRLRASDPLATLRICGQRVHELSAPARFQGVHQDLTQATIHSTRAVTLYAQGVDELNSDKLSQSAEEMSLAEVYMQQATAKLETISQ